MSKNAFHQLKKALMTSRMSLSSCCSLLVPEAQKLILNCPLTVYTPHNLGGILNSKGEL
jgi:hypothetical protein